MLLHFHLCVVCLMLASLYQGRNSLCDGAKSADLSYKLLLILLAILV